MKPQAIWARFTSRPILICLALLLATSHRAAGQNDAPSPFDGKSLDGWTTQDGKPVTQSWEVADGVIHRKPEKGRAGNIITAEEFGDFRLTFEWKIAERGNSGLKYRVRSYGGKILGLEYQIYDDEGSKKRVKPKGSAGALYDLYEPNDAKQLNPPGQYNLARIVVAGNRIEHWLNGKLIVSATVGDDEWRRRIAESKFSDVPDFGLNPRGKIMLTDHGSEVWYRNFVFEPLTAAGESPPKGEAATIVNSAGMKLVKISAGEFQMGSSESAEKL